MQRISNPSVARAQKQRWLRACFVALAVIALIWKLRWMGTVSAPVDDFAEYWAASRLLVSGQNPYSTEALLAIQRPFTGWDKPLIMWNPPWTLGLLFPLGFLEYSTSRWLWLVLNLGLLLISARWLGGRYLEVHDRTRRATMAHLGIALTFLPGVIALSLGQIGLVILAGIVAFLSLVDRKRYFLAGAATMLMALKPQLLFLFWLVLLLWVWRTARWSLLAGAVTAIIFGVGVPWLFCENVISGYINLVGKESIFHHPSTTTGALLRLALGWDEVWLQVATMVPGVLWVAYYWIRHRNKWDWVRQLPLLLLVSVVTTCYGWVFDQTVLYPALFQAVGWLLATGQPHERMLAAGSYAFINLAGAWMIARGFNGVGYVWMAPAWLVCHCVAARLWSGRSKVAGFATSSPAA